MIKSRICKRIVAGLTAVAMIAVSQSQLLSQLAVSAENNKVEAKSKKYLLIQDNAPWSSSANTTVLNAIGAEYDVVTTSGFLEVELEQYAVVIFANDQEFSTYNNYLSFKEYMELYAELGGVIVFGAADGGWADGEMTGNLPGDVEKKSEYVNYNYVADMEHPIITAALSDGDGAAVEGRDTSMWYSTYCSHSDFTESTLPVGTNVLVRSVTTDRPTLVEYPLGKGRVIASGLTLEYSYDRFNNFSRHIMDDIFLYAMRVSTIDGADVSQLRDYRLNCQKHYIVVADAATQQPIKDATVTVGDKIYKTDENGTAAITDNLGLRKVKVSAVGYLSKSIKYELMKGKARVFYLGVGTDSSKPYVMSAYEENQKKDLLTQMLYFDKDETKYVRIQLEVEWNDKTPGEYLIYQNGRYGVTQGVRLTSTNGRFCFQPGMKLNPDEPVYLRVTASDGTQSAPVQLKLKVKNVPARDYLAGVDDEFEVTPPQDGTVSDSKITNVFPGDFELNISCLPIHAYGEADEDNGTYTVRMLIGCDLKNASESDTVFEYMSSFFKETYEEGCKNADKMNEIYGKIMNHLDKPFATAKIKSDFEPSAEISGYYEIVYDAKGAKISEGGGIVFNIGGEYTYTQQFALGPVPVYLSLGGGIEFETVNGMTIDKQTKKVDYVGEISITVSFTLSGGLGVAGVISVGVGGGIDFEIQIAPQCTGDITFRAFIEAYLIFVVDWEYNLASTTLHLWPKNQPKPKTIADALAAIKTEGTTEYSLIETGYTAKTTPWNGTVSDGLNMLQSYLLPGTVPQIVEADGKQVMVWQTTDSTQDTVNSTALMSSYLSGGVWSEPARVSSEPGADLFAKLVSDGKDIYLVWQKQDANITGDDTAQLIEKALAGSDICFAKWNGTSFGETQFIIQDDTLDMLPALAAENGKLTAAWVKNANNDPFGIIGGNKVVTSEYKNGAWSEPAVLAETNEFVSELDADYSNGSVCVAYSTLDTSEDDSQANAYAAYNGKVTDISNNTSAELGIQFCDGTLYYSCDGKLYTYQAGSASATAAKGSLGTLGASFKVTGNGNGKSLIWNDGDKLRVSVSTDAGWSEPLVLNDYEGVTIRNYDAICKDGVYSVIMNTGDPNEADKTSLCYLSQKLTESIDIDFVTALYVPGSAEQTIMCKVTNNEGRTVDGVNVELKNDALTLVSAKEDISLEPGESAVFEYECNTASLKEKTEFTMTVSDDKYSSNAPLVLGKPDISVEVETYYVEDSITMAINVSNLTGTPTKAAIKITEDAVDGMQLDVKNAGIISNEEGYLMLEKIDISEIDFNENGAKYYYIQVEADGEEASTANNEVMVAVYAPEPAYKPAETSVEYDATDNGQIPEDEDEGTQVKNNDDTSPKTGVAMPVGAIALCTVSLVAAVAISISRRKRAASK